MTPYLNGGPVYLTATQYANSYLRSTALKKTVSVINGNSDISTPLSKFDANKDIFAAANLLSGVEISLFPFIIETVFFKAVLRKYEFAYCVAVKYSGPPFKYGVIEWY